MAKVINVINTTDGQFPKTFNVELKVKSGTTSSILPGYLVIKDGSNAGYAAAAPDGTDTDDTILGVAVSTSNETGSADGVVQVVTGPRLLVQIFAKTPGSLATALLLDNYALDVTSGNYTLDQGTTTKGIFRLVSYDNTTSGLCTASIACSL